MPAAARCGLSLGELGDQLLDTKSFLLSLGRRQEIEKVGQSEESWKEKLQSSGAPKYWGFFVICMCSWGPHW